MRKHTTLNHKIHHTCMTRSDMLSIMVVSLEAMMENRYNSRFHSLLFFTERHILTFRLTPVYQNLRDEDAGKRRAYHFNNNSTFLMNEYVDVARLN